MATLIALNACQNWSEAVDILLEARHQALRTSLKDTSSMTLSSFLLSLANIVRYTWSHLIHLTLGVEGFFSTEQPNTISLEEQCRTPLSILFAPLIKVASRGNSSYAMHIKRYLTRYDRLFSEHLPQMRKDLTLASLQQRTERWSMEALTLLKASIEEHLASVTDAHVLAQARIDILTWLDASHMEKGYASWQQIRILLTDTATSLWDDVYRSPFIATFERIAQHRFDVIAAQVDTVVAKHIDSDTFDMPGKSIICLLVRHTLKHQFSIRCKHKTTLCTIKNTHRLAIVTKRLCINCTGLDT
jgi:hypothetical protein